MSGSERSPSKPLWLIYPTCVPWRASRAGARPDRAAPAGISPALRRLQPRRFPPCANGSSTADGMGSLGLSFAASSGTGSRGVSQRGEMEPQGGRVTMGKTREDKP